MKGLLVFLSICLTATGILAQQTYEGKGWISLGDWLGTGMVATNKRTYLDFSDARKIVKNMKLKNIEEWKTFTKSSQFPADLPKAPDQYYSKNGDWISYGDWLGTDRIATNDIKFLPISEALKIVHSLNLKSNKEWASYCKINNLPTGIPKAPAIVYSNSGWINWGHWLGTNLKATKEIVYVDYTTAKNILKKHDIRTFREYKQFIINFSSEYSLPSMPVRTYKNEWLGSKDFFGK